MATAENKRYECIVCQARIQRIVYADKINCSPNVHAEEWRCPNGHSTEKVLII